MELIVLIIIGVFVVVYRNYKGQNVYKYISNRAGSLYDKFAPYSFKVVREKTKQLGQEYTVRQYTIQIAIFSIFAGVVSYLYFYNLFISLIYIFIEIAIIHIWHICVVREFIVSFYLNKYKFIQQIQ